MVLFKLTRENVCCGLTISVMSGRTPILISCEVLKRMGALLNFGIGEVCFVWLSQFQSFRLPRAHNGHLVFPLLGDLVPHRALQNAVGYSLCRIFYVGECECT